MNPPYRADHIGSFLRPSELLEARKNASREELQALEGQQIRRILALQKELGFELATDGKFRRRNFMSDFTDAVEGFDLGDAVGRTWNAGQAGAAPVSSVTGIFSQKLRQVRSLTKASRWAMIQFSLSIIPPIPSTIPRSAHPGLRFELST